MANDLPWIKFHTADWRNDPNLSRCSKAAKGVWVDCICILNETEVRGVFRTNSIPWSDQEIALAIGGDMTENIACLNELVVKGVCARSTDGALFSRRMVRDEEKRRKCSEAGKAGGGNPKLRPLNESAKAVPKVAPKVPPKVPSDSYTLSSVSCVSSEEKKELGRNGNHGTDQFEKLIALAEFGGLKVTDKQKGKALTLWLSLRAEDHAPAVALYEQRVRTSAAGYIPWPHNFLDDPDLWRKPQPQRLAPEPRRMSKAEAAQKQAEREFMEGV